MLIQSCETTLDRSHRELQAHGTHAFPCAAYDDSYKNTDPDIMPWHWHEELEIVQVTSGRLLLQIPGHTLRLEAQETAIVNSGILHAAIGDPECRVLALVFHPSLITGASDSVFSERYIRPLTECTAFQAVRLNEAASLFAEAFNACFTAPSGFEFVVRDRLSSICMRLFAQFTAQIEANAPQSDHDAQRIRTMVRYIQEHFAEQLCVGQIARAAHIGERECLRCFQRTLHISPGQYVLQHRITHGAALLLKHPDISISQIASLCGFESPSNFSRNFRRYYKLTPREYRAGSYQFSCAR